MVKTEPDDRKRGGVFYASRDDGLGKFPRQCFVSPCVLFSTLQPALVFLQAANGDMLVEIIEQQAVERGGVMIKTNEHAPVAAVEKIRANVMWLGARPLARQQTYLLKLGAAKVSAQLEKIERIFGDDDTGDSPNANGAEELRRHHSGAVVLKLSHPLVVTKFADSQTLGRFVIVDSYDAVGGIVQEILIADTADTAGTSPSFSDATAASRDAFIDELFALLRWHFPERF